MFIKHLISFISLIFFVYCGNAFSQYEMTNREENIEIIEEESETFNSEWSNPSSESSYPQACELYALENAGSRSYLRKININNGAVLKTWEIQNSNLSAINGIAAAIGDFRTIDNTNKIDKFNLQGAGSVESSFISTVNDAGVFANSNSLIATDNNSWPNKIYSVNLTSKLSNLLTTSTKDILDTAILNGLIYYLTVDFSTSASRLNSYNPFTNTHLPIGISTSGIRMTGLAAVGNQLWALAQNNGALYHLNILNGSATLKFNLPLTPWGKGFDLASTACPPPSSQTPKCDAKLSLSTNTVTVNWSNIPGGNGTILVNQSPTYSFTSIPTGSKIFGPYTEFNTKYYTLKYSQNGIDVIIDCGHVGWP